LHLGQKWDITSSPMPSEFLPFRPEPLNLLMKVRRHFTEHVLAEKLDVNRKTISRWESRRIPLPLSIEPALRETLRGICDNQCADTSFTFIDLFAGIGGIRKGFESAGGKAIFTSEWNPWAQKTYAANFGDENQLVGDIVEFPTEEIPDHDVRLAGFPCQPFSIAGVSKENSLGRPHGFGQICGHGLSNRNRSVPIKSDLDFSSGKRTATRIECCYRRNRWSRGMAKNDGWSREQLIVALKLYCEMPFGKMHSRNPDIIRFAKLIGRSPSALAMKLTNLASLDPQIRSSGRKGLSGASQADRDIWEEMTSDWDLLANEIARVELYYTGVGLPVELEVDSEEILVSYAGKTRSVTVEARIGQSFFRQSVLSAYEFKCCISGIAIPELLVASHIVPWRADPSNRLNPRNGLCLSAIHDRAFDLGLIAISDDLTLLLSARLRHSGTNSYIGHTFRSYEGKTITMPEKFPPNSGFLKFHRENVFCE